MELEWVNRVMFNCIDRKGVLEVSTVCCCKGGHVGCGEESFPWWGYILSRKIKLMALRFMA
jgi:hypothetical protein